MSKTKSIFERKEKKYLLSFSDFKMIESVLKKHLTLDDYGKHTINSLYYDTMDFALIRASIEKPLYKEKFRIRSYGDTTEETLTFVEIKKKYQGIVGKRRIALPYQKVQQGLQNNKFRTADIENGIPQITEEINWFLQRYSLFPQVLIMYERMAYYDKKNKDFRVTFDFNIRWRDEVLDLTKGDEGLLITDEFYCLMEVKALGSFPLWLTHLLAKEEIYPNSFSKYAQCYIRNLFPKQKHNIQNNNYIWSKEQLKGVSYVF